MISFSVAVLAWTGARSQGAEAWWQDRRYTAGPHVWLRPRVCWSWHGGSVGVRGVRERQGVRAQRMAYHVGPVATW